MLFCHVSKACKTSGIGLGVDSEQAGETIHSRFKEFSRYKLPNDFTKDKYHEYLKKIVNSYNVERL